MDTLSGRTILVISPQSWGRMLVSKHHYAVELAKRGNQVYFLNPPDQANQRQRGDITIIRSDIHPGLFLIDHRLSFPYAIKFHFIAGFHWLMRPHIKRILKKIGQSVDLVWSFDLGHLYPFSQFPAGAYKVFHPVDEPLNQAAIDSAAGARVILSVTREILERYHSFDIPKYFINHGVSPEFLEEFDISDTAGDPVRIGFSGNLLREDIDRKTFLQITDENPAVIFECWGSYQSGQSNIGGGRGEATMNFIRSLQSKSNVILHGAVDSKTLARELARMDAFLICYDINKDQSKGTNYHKVMEYFSRGKVIISNNITTYAGEPDLIRMTRSRTGNEELPALFKETIIDLPRYNAVALQQQRIQYARQNSYVKQIDKISRDIIKSGWEQ